MLSRAVECSSKTMGKGGRACTCGVITISFIAKLNFNTDKEISAESFLLHDIDWRDFIFSIGITRSLSIRQHAMIIIVAASKVSLKDNAPVVKSYMHNWMILPFILNYGDL